MPVITRSRNAAHNSLEVKPLNYNLERYKSAQIHDYDNALREVRAGRKTSHWIWYIFPQAYSLGHSSMADYYGIRSIDEAKAYLTDPVLGLRLVEISEALMELEDKNAAKIFGFPDVLKVRSCMTLFAEISEEDSVFHRVLNTYYHGEKDELTVEWIKQGSK